MYSNPRAVILENAPNVLAEIYQSICNFHTFVFILSLPSDEPVPKQLKQVSIVGRIAQNQANRDQFKALLIPRD